MTGPMPMPVLDTLATAGQADSIEGSAQVGAPHQSQRIFSALTDGDINIITTDGVFRVAVDYRVPLNLLVYSPKLKFRAIGSGFLRE